MVFHEILKVIFKFPKVLIRNQTQKLAFGRAIAGNGDSRMSAADHQLVHRLQTGFGLDICAADNEACFMGLHLLNHLNLTFDALRAENHTHSPLTGESYC